MAAIAVDHVEDDGSSRACWVARAYGAIDAERFGPRYGAGMEKRAAAAEATTRLDARRGGGGNDWTFRL
jgi:hypothetical protein